MKQPADFEAEITFFATGTGGRKQPAFSGYRPSRDLGLSGTLNDTQHDYVGADNVEPGKSSIARLRLLRPDLQIGRLFTGMKFTVQEGSRIVGYGTIVRVLNDELVRVAEQSDESWAGLRSQSFSKLRFGPLGITLQS